MCRIRSPPLFFFLVLQKLKEQGKGAVFVGSSFIYGLIGSTDLVPKIGELEAFLQQVERDSAEEDRQRALKKLSKAEQEAKAKEAAEAAPVAAAAATNAKPKQLVRTKDTVSITTKDKKGKKVSEKVTGLVELVVFAYEGHQEKVVNWFREQGFTSEAQ